MADQGNEAVRNGAHGAWPIHYHMVFPVKHRKALFDAAVTTLVQELAADIAERFPIEMEAIRTDKNHIPCSAVRTLSVPGASRTPCHKSYSGHRLDPDFVPTPGRPDSNPPASMESRPKKSCHLCRVCGTRLPQNCSRSSDVMRGHCSVQGASVVMVYAFFSGRG